MPPTVTVVICARGGSKGIPRKNVKQFHGHPLIAWVIRSALGAERVDHVLVTSDDAEILAVAREYGAETHTRPVELAQDTSTVEVGVIDALSSHPAGRAADRVILAQATSPLTRSADFDAALNAMDEQGWDSLLTGVPSHIFHWQVEDGIASPVNYDPKNRPRRQDRVGLHRENGAFYIAERRIWDGEACRLGGRIGLHPMREWQAFEIDSEDDWRLLETLAADLALEIE